MAANKNWPRWIFASFSKWFDSQKDGVTMFVEGDDYVTSDLSDYFEFRTNGPHFWEQSKDFWEFMIVINILVVHKKDSSSIHTLHVNVGKMVAAFQNSVPIYRYGTGPDDDGQVLGCMQLLTDAKNVIQVDQLGQLRPEIKEMQAMVQGTYCMYLEV